MQVTIDISPVSECAILVRIGHSNHDTPLLVEHLNEQLYKHLDHCIMNITPSIDSLLIDYLPHRISLSRLTERIEQIVDTINLEDVVSENQVIIRLPIFYHIDVGPDIKRYQLQGIQLDELITAHTSQIYTVAAIGFAPGFAFYNTLTRKLDCHVTPHQGSPYPKVALALQKIAPLSTPVVHRVVGTLLATVLLSYITLIISQ
nr:carboxyltransferase domain-containing protein [Vibrio taketomensis]